MAIMDTLFRRMFVKNLHSVKSLVFLPQPKQGWIKSFRKIIGLSSGQLGKNLNCTQQRISYLEKAEIEGRTSLKTMKKVAKAMDCYFCYAFIPYNTLDQFIDERVETHSQKNVKDVQHKEKVAAEMKSQYQKKFYS